MLAHGERMANLIRKIPFGATFSNLGMSIGKAFVKVMNVNGCEVLIDRQFKCCGSPLVVTPCPGCQLMLKAEYHELFGEEKFHEAAQNVYDVFEFLEILQECDEFNGNFKPLNLKLLYHVLCHFSGKSVRNFLNASSNTTLTK